LIGYIHVGAGIRRTRMPSCLDFVEDRWPKLFETGAVVGYSRGTKEGWASYRHFFFFFFFFFSLLS
jgi:hypothetical protein